MSRTKLLAFILVAVAVGHPAANEEPSDTVIESKFELFITDAAESTAFYVVLGFTIAHAKPGGYTTLRSGSTVIALSPVPWWFPNRLLGPLRYPPIGTEIVLYTEQLEQTRASLEEEGYSPGEIVTQSWGDRDFRVTDPDGYYIRVSEGAAIPASP